MCVCVPGRAFLPCLRKNFFSINSCYHSKRMCKMREEEQILLVADVLCRVDQVQMILTDLVE